MTELIFEKSVAGRKGVRVPNSEFPVESLQKIIPRKYLRKKPPALPEVGELQVVRHYVELSKKNFSIDEHFYPLGSCTMKYNPKIHEKIAGHERFCSIHPLNREEDLQGVFEVIYETEQALAKIAGLDVCTTQPAAGAQGELTGLLLIRALLRQKGKMEKDIVLIPDSAHGTNPATCAMAGLVPVQVKSNEQGLLDIEDLKAKANDKVCALMITNPNTLGIFESNIEKICDIVHSTGGYVYMDGANMNALVGMARPGEFGIDVMHFNLHKTFTTPHGGGGPGCGAVAAREMFKPFLPHPRIVKENGRFRLDWNSADSIGKLTTYLGNVGMIIRAYVYIKTLGDEGLREMSRTAVMNANYMYALLKEHFPARFKYPKGRCMHEVVLSNLPLAKKFHVRMTDIAKRLLDYGFHPPTIYFPLIVPEAMMIEPTETETVETIEAFANALIKIKQEAMSNPQLVQGAPYKTPVKRVDELTAARQPVLRWTPPKKNSGKRREPHRQVAGA